MPDKKDDLEPTIEDDDDDDDDGAHGAARG